MSSAPRFTSYQKWVVGILTFLQFTIILDFMIMAPLGAIMMPALKISASQFALVVSAYAFSAGISGFLAAGFADRFDRKKLLLFFYAGFLLGTFLCGMAPNFTFLLFARMVTGFFGGVIGSIVFAITTDLFSFEMRGRVMGFLQTAFAVSQILGIPLGLYLSTTWGWRMPFFMIVGVSFFVGILIVFLVKPIDAHLQMKPDRSPFHHLLVTVSSPHYFRAFLTVALLATGGFMLMPFSSAYSVHNLGVPLEKLPMVYMVTGCFSIFMGPIVGKFSDSLGKYRVFIAGSAVTVIMILIYTHLGLTPLAGVIAVSVVMFAGMTARMIPSQALMSAIPTATSRGSFMSVSSSLQQLSGGLASVFAGLIVSEDVGGVLLHFDILGYVVVATTLLTIYLMYGIHKQVAEKTEPIL